MLNRLLALKLRNFMSGNILGGGLVRSFIGRYLVGLEIENQGLPARASSGPILLGGFGIDSGDVFELLLLFRFSSRLGVPSCQVSLVV